MKNNYFEPTLLIVSYTCEGGFAVSSNMDGGSPVTNLGWD